MTVLKCDRCGKTGYTNRRGQSNEIVRYGVHTDLCDECYGFLIFGCVRSLIRMMMSELSSAIWGCRNDQS